MINGLAEFISIVGLTLAFTFALYVLKRNVTFRWWVYYRAIKRSRKREWDAYVDYYNGIRGPEKWEHLLHVTELLRKRRDLERWNQWVPDAKSMKNFPAVSQKVEVRGKEARSAAAVIRDFGRWVEENTREETPRATILEMVESYAIIQDSRTLRPIKSDNLVWDRDYLEYRSVQDDT